MLIANEGTLKNQICKNFNLETIISCNTLCQNLKLFLDTIFIFYNSPLTSNL